MPLQDRKAFIKDPRPNMTTEEKNMHLSAKLGVAPHAKREIFRIERIEIEASGWQVHYRTGSPE